MAAASLDQNSKTTLSADKAATNSANGILKSQADTTHTDAIDADDKPVDSSTEQQQKSVQVDDEKDSQKAPDGIFSSLIVASTLHNNVNHSVSPIRHFPKAKLDIRKHSGRYDGWEAMWSAGGGLKKGQAFDAEAPLPALTSWLSSSSPSELGVPEGGTALVAGCGRGYAPIAFSQRGYKAVGLDVSSTAIASANKHLSTIDGGHTLPVSFTEGSFFDYPDDNSFDMAYDYTFFCALQPEDRKPWAQTYARIIKQKGILLTGMFPVDKNRKGGPPFAVTTELYQSVLEPVGFALVEEPVVLSNEEAHEGRGNGKTMFGIWRNVGVKKDGQ